jgi:hypothetical protein
MKTPSDFVISAHAYARLQERGIDKSVLWAARRQAIRSNLADHLLDQQKKFSQMLSENDLHVRVGQREYVVSTKAIATRLDIEGVTLAVGIKREGEGYTPLTVTTAWN